MSYTVKLAIFPPWQAPAPFKALDRVFATVAEAASAAEQALASVTKRELSELESQLQVRRHGATTALGVPETPVSGYLIFDDAGVEVRNWTTLDVAAERAAKAESSDDGRP